MLVRPRVVDESDHSSLTDLDVVLVAVSRDLNVVPSTVDTSLTEGSSPYADSIDSIFVPLADLC